MSYPHIVAGRRLASRLFTRANKRRNRRGSPVPYRAVDDLGEARRWLLDAECTHHRGALEVRDGTGRRIAQLVDPFGNVIGIDGL